MGSSDIYTQVSRCKKFFRDYLRNGMENFITVEDFKEGIINLIANLVKNESVETAIVWASVISMSGHIIHNGSKYCVMLPPTHQALKYAEHCIEKKILVYTVDVYKRRPDFIPMWANHDTKKEIDPVCTFEISCM